ncbi:MAG: ATP-binding protein [Bacteroidales bacterium]|nr:ATP-binding protein [Bacteroidales bacterium]HOY39883.1 ATP-binding protein [Bacteroidales bacterium]
MFTRKLFHIVKEHLNRKEFSIIVGARQVGKTTILRQIEKFLQKSGESVYFISLEDFDVLQELNKHPENIFKFVSKQKSSRMYVLIDEIQYLDKPSNFLKLLYDKYADELKIVATGSSAFYIDKKFADSLAGRKRLFYLPSLDFEEFLIFKKAENLIAEVELIKQQEDYISLHRNEIQSLFNEFLTFGGYPGVVIESQIEEKHNVLKDLYNSYLKKDVVDAGIQDQPRFYKLLTLLAHQTGSLLNVNEISNTLGLSNTAVNNYIEVLNKSFHISKVSPFSNNIRNELTKMPKIYFSDLGFRNIILNSFNPIDNRIDKGIIVENFIYKALINHYDKDNVKHWRTADGDEVDFVVEAMYSKFAIEAKFNCKQFNPKKYARFNKFYPDIPISCKAYISDKNSDNVLSLF